VTREDVKDLQPTCNQLANDCISRQMAIDAIGEKSDEIYKTKQKGATYPHDDFFQGMAYAENVVKQLPPVQPEKRTETSACDCISRQAAIRIASGYCHPANIAAELAKLPPVQPYTEAEIQKMQELEQAELEKAFKLGKADVLKKIRAEIDRQEKWLLQAGYTAYNVDIAFDTIKAVLAESENKKCI
jgi:hypothetical protein